MKLVKTTEWLQDMQVGTFKCDITLSLPSYHTHSTVVFPKEGQLAERGAKKHGLQLHQIWLRYALWCQELLWTFAAQGQ
jgi:hypothetical protein